MQNRLTAFFLENKIDCFGFLPLEACSIQKQYLLDRVGIQSGSVAIFAIPYYTPMCEGDRNLSAYAVAKDYHLYFQMLTDKLLALLRSEFPSYRFAAFADHSPIDEREVAALAGLGVLGKNGLLITEKYSSYVFLGELITDASLYGPPREINSCIGCGACKKVCPLAKGEIKECLSAITQRKSDLLPSEEQAIRKYNSVWGCDLCQEICPHTKKAREKETLYSPLSFFEEDAIPCLTKRTLLQTDDSAFAARAYSWRGRDVILRNLTLQEKQNDTDQKAEPIRDQTLKEKS